MQTSLRKSPINEYISYYLSFYYQTLVSDTDKKWTYYSRAFKQIKNSYKVHENATYSSYCAILARGRNFRRKKLNSTYVKKGKGTGISYVMAAWSKYCRSFKKFSIVPKNALVRHLRASYSMYCYMCTLRNNPIIEDYDKGYLKYCSSFRIMCMSLIIHEMWVSYYSKKIFEYNPGKFKNPKMKKLPKNSGVQIEERS